MFFAVLNREILMVVENSFRLSGCVQYVDKNSVRTQREEDHKVLVHRVLLK